MSKELTSYQQVFIEPGYIYLPTVPTNLYAVLGSCVSVCLWDKKLKIGGMNHFLYPSISSKEKATSQYGNVATLQLIQMMEKAGAKTNSIFAQIIGGAIPPFNKRDKDIGRDNVEVARRILKSKGIKIVSEDVGGHMGRKIVFNSYTGHIMVLKVYQIRKDDWILELPEE